MWIESYDDKETVEVWKRENNNVRTKEEQEILLKAIKKLNNELLEDIRGIKDDIIDDIRGITDNMKRIAYDASEKSKKWWIYFSQGGFVRDEKYADIWPEWKSNSIY